MCENENHYLFFRLDSDSVFLRLICLDICWLYFWIFYWLLNDDCAIYFFGFLSLFGYFLFFVLFSLLRALCVSVCFVCC